MKVKKSSSFDLEMKSDLDILNYGGHDYLLSASALPIDEQLFQPQLGILGEGKTTMSCVVLLLRDDTVASATAEHSKEKTWNFYYILFALLHCHFCVERWIANCNIVVIISNVVRERNKQWMWRKKELICRDEEKPVRHQRLNASLSAYVFVTTFLSSNPSLARSTTIMLISFGFEKMVRCVSKEKRASFHCTNHQHNLTRI